MDPRKPRKLEVIKATESSFVQAQFLTLAVAINATLVYRPGQPYQPKAVEFISGEVN